MDLLYSMAIPIPSFIISVVYLIYAYFRIYNTPAPRRPPTAAAPPANLPNSTTNNNIGGGGGGGGGSLNSADMTTTMTPGNMAPKTGGGSNSNKGRVVEGSNGNHSGGGLLPNSSSRPQMFEMNDLNPGLHSAAGGDADLALPRRNNRAAPERGSSTNPHAKTKGYADSPLLLTLDLVRNE